MNDTLFVSLHAGLYAQYQHEKECLKRAIAHLRKHPTFDRDYKLETIAFWVWALRETRRQFRAIREKRKSVETVPSEAPKQDPEVTVTWLAAMLGKSRSVIWGRIKNGQLPAPTMMGRKAFWKLSELEQHKSGKKWKGALSERA